MEVLTYWMWEYWPLDVLIFSRSFCRKNMNTFLNNECKRQTQNKLYNIQEIMSFLWSLTLIVSTIFTLKIKSIACSCPSNPIPKLSYYAKTQPTFAELHKNEMFPYRAGWWKVFTSFKEETFFYCWQLTTTLSSFLF